MARRGSFGTGGSGSNAAGDVIKNILSMQSTGETAAPAGTTDGTAKKTPSRTSTYDLRKALAAAKPDYSGLDFTGMDRKQIKAAKKATWTPEYIAARKAIGARKKELMTPYTAAEIASDPTKKALASGITFEQALAAYRKQVKLMNLVPLEGQSRTKAQEAKYKKLLASMTPVQKNAQRILGLLGGFGQFGASPSRGLLGETTQETVFRRLGLPLPTERGMVNESVRIDPKFGPIISIANPLNQKQRSRLQRLRSLGSLSDRQKQALARLRSKKNAPIPYTEE